MRYVPPASDAQARSWLEAGLGFHRQGDFERAVGAYRQALALVPDQPDALNLLGTALLQWGEPAEALAHLQRAARRSRDNPGVIANLAQAYLALERYDEAADAFRKASRIEPQQVQFQLGLATVLALQTRLGEAETLLKRMTTRFPESALAWFNLGNVIRDQKRHEEALGAYRKALALDEHLIDARNNLGSVLQSLQRFAEAEEHYRECLDRSPHYRIARYNLASVIMDRGHFRESERVCRDLVAAEPDSPAAHAFLGSAVAQQGRLLEALPHHEHAARLAPDNDRYAASYGTSLLEVGRAAEGLRWLANTIARAREPDAPRQLAATALLAHGQLQDGWAEYTRRVAAIRFREKYADLRLATSLPVDLNGMTICVLREQGLGDEIFFLRYAPVLAARGAKVAYRASDKLLTLLARASPIADVIGEDAAPPAAQAYVLVGDLAHVLGQCAQSALPDAPVAKGAAIPAFQRRIAVYWPPVPTSLRLEPLTNRLDEQRARLAALGPPPYIGLTWRAGTMPEEQRGGTWMLYKTIGIPQIAGAIAGSKGTLIALQRKPAEGEIDALAAAIGRPVHDLTALNEDLEGMLAVLTVIDDYVGLSNTNMHLRAAVGRSARVLVPAPAEWRWMQSGRSSPWFPGFTIYRQSLQGDWSEALARLKSDLVGPW